MGGHVKVPVRRRRVRVVSVEQTQPLPEVQEQRDQEQHRRRDQDDLERRHFLPPGRNGRRPDERQGCVRREVLRELPIPFVDRLQLEILRGERRRLRLLRVRQALGDDERRLGLGPRLFLQLLRLEVLLVRDLRREDGVVELLRELVIRDRELVDDDVIRGELVLQRDPRLDRHLLALLDELEACVLRGHVLERLLDLLVDDPILVVRPDVLEDEWRLRRVDVEVDRYRRVDGHAVLRGRARLDLLFLDPGVEYDDVVPERHLGVNAGVEDVRVIGIDGAEMLHDADLADPNLRVRTEHREDEDEEYDDPYGAEADRRPRASR